MEEVSLEDRKKYEAVMSKARRIQAQAAAILDRAVEAGIPKDYQRINKGTFTTFLEPTFLKQRYNTTPEAFASSLFDQPDKLFDKRFILIDGGSPNSGSRLKAGFALLFRMIACDKIGLHQQGDQLINLFNTFDKSKSELVSELQTPDVLLISNLSIYGFSPNMGGGKYMDEILEYRFLNALPTIISFAKPIFVREGGNDGSLSDERAGRYLLQLAHADVPQSITETEEDLKTLRVRVK